MKTWYSEEEAKAMKKAHPYSKSRPLTQREWLFNDSGSREPSRGSWDNIHAAYNDARCTDSYVYGY